MLREHERRTMFVALCLRGLVPHVVCFQKKFYIMMMMYVFGGLGRRRRVYGDNYINENHTQKAEHIVRGCGGP